jgi:hypothetical protein
MGGGVAGIEFQGLSELGLAAEKSQLSILLLARTACGCASVGSSSRAFGCSIRLGNDITGVTAVSDGHEIGIRQPCICRRVTGILVDGLIEVGDCSLNVGGGALAPVVTAFHANLVSLCILCLAW